MATTCAPNGRVLIADDQPDLIDALRLLLKGVGMQMEAVTSPEAALAAIAKQSYDLLLMDLNYTADTTSGREGIDLLARVQEVDEHLPVVVMTGWGSVNLAVESMRRGVRDFVQKPWDNQQLLETLRTEIARGRAARDASARQARELDEARRIQRKLLPTDIPHIDGCEIATWWQPAAGVGGDCYDVISFGPSRAALSIADVVGKGIPAALLMSNLQAAVRAFASDANPPGALCHQVNRILCGNIAEGRFISFFYCVTDTEAGTLTYANAGHYPPVLLRADGTCERLTEGGPVLGIFDDAIYGTATVRMAPGDRLILYTDGITEAMNADGDEFGEDRLIDSAIAHRADGADVLRALISEELAAFADAGFHDDATLIVLATT